MRQNPASARRQAGFLAGPGRQQLQRLQLGLQLLPRRQIALQRLPRGLCGFLRPDQRPPGAGHRLDEAVMAGEPVEQDAMRGFIQQAPLLELAMHLDQVPAHPPQETGCNRHVVHKGARASVAPDRPAQNQLLARIDLQIPERRRCFLRRLVEAGDHVGPFRAGPHKPAVRTCAQRQAERIQQNGLAPAGLARKHRKARPE